MLDTLTAAAVELDRRLIEGTIVPFGVPGLTSAGRLTIEAGALVWAPDLSRLKLTREHDRTAPVAYATVLEPRAGGLFARFKVAPTPEGDTALLEAAEHVRDGLSVDLVDVILSDDGTRVVSGRIATVGLCSVPAYDEARVTRVAATQPNEGSVMDTLTTEPVDPTPPGPADPPHAVSAAAPALPDPEPVAVLATVPAGSTRTEPRSPLTLQAAAGTIARAARGDLAPSAMMAALSDFTTAPASGGGAIPPQWVGQLWEEADATRIHVDAVNGGSAHEAQGAQVAMDQQPLVGEHFGHDAAHPLQRHRIRSSGLQRAVWDSHSRSPCAESGGATG
jgi:phage head maturation protease